MILSKLDSQLLMQSVPITTKVVSLNPTHSQVYSIQHYVIKFVRNLLQVGGFLWVLQFPPPIKKTDCHDISEILLKVGLNTITRTPCICIECIFTINKLTNLGKASKFSARLTLFLISASNKFCCMIPSSNTALVCRSVRFPVLLSILNPKKVMLCWSGLKNRYG